MDDEGFFRIVDRMKDMIIVSGFNVYPTEVEAVLYRPSEGAEGLRGRACPTTRRASA